MAVTAPASLSKIIAEFVGPNNLSAYYRGGGYVGSNNTNVSATVAGLSINSFVGAVRFSGVNGNYVSERLALGQNPEVTFESNGNVLEYGFNATTDWGTPLTTGIGSGYEIVTTAISGSGTFLAGGIGTYNLGSGQAFRIQAAPAGQARARYMSYIIRVAGGGATICSGTIELISDLTG